MRDLSGRKLLVCVAILIAAAEAFGVEIAADHDNYPTAWPSPLTNENVQGCPSFSERYEVLGEISDLKPKQLVEGNRFPDLFVVFLFPVSKEPPPLADRTTLKVEDGALQVSFLNKDDILSREVLIHGVACRNGWLIASRKIDTNSEGATRMTESHYRLVEAKDQSLVIHVRHVHRTSTLLLFRTLDITSMWIRFKPKARD